MRILDTLSLTRGVWEKMRTEAQKYAPEEACGLLAGQEGRASEIFSIPNSLHSPVRYRMDPHDQWEAFQSMEARGLDLVGIYHSHPSGPEIPSLTDIAEAYYPEVVYLIWSQKSGGWQCRGFQIQNGVVKDVPLQIFN